MRTACRIPFFWTTCFVLLAVPVAILSQQATPCEHIFGLGCGMGFAEMAALKNDQPSWVLDTLTKNRDVARSLGYPVEDFKPILQRLRSGASSQSVYQDISNLRQRLQQVSATLYAGQSRTSVAQQAGVCQHLFGLGCAMGFAEMASLKNDPVPWVLDVLRQNRDIAQNLGYPVDGFRPILQQLNAGTPTRNVYGAISALRINLQQRTSGLYVCTLVGQGGGPGPGSGGGGAHARCDQYARTAVAQFQENQRLGCGWYDDRWHADYNLHYKWCVGVTQAQADGETQLRERMLAQCRAGGGAGGGTGGGAGGGSGMSCDECAQKKCPCQGVIILLCEVQDGSPNSQACRDCIQRNCSGAGGGAGGTGGGAGSGGWVTYNCPGHGTMRFRWQGASVTGTYDWSGGGKVEGVMQGNNLVGKWSDGNGRGNTNYQFTADRSRFEHYWQWEGASQWSNAGTCTCVR